MFQDLTTAQKAELFDVFTIAMAVHYADIQERNRAAAAESLTRAQKVAATWLDDETRRRRLKRDRVTVSVDGAAPIGFRSVMEAIAVLGLPLGRKGFRLKLKAAKALNYTHGGHLYSFAIAN